MRSGFTYKGIHSSNFGITAKTKSRPILPEMKYSSLESGVMDGVYDFSEANEYGRAFYNDRFFEIQIQAAAENLCALERKVSKIASWLKGSGELRFDDIPLVKWNAKVVSELGFMPEINGRVTVMTAVFRVEPFGLCEFDTADGPALDSAMELDTNIPLDFPSAFMWEFTGGSDYEAVSKTLKIINAGTAEARPVIRLDGAVKNVSVVCGGRVLLINDAQDGFVIDCAKCSVTNGDGDSVMTKVIGDFPELAVGVNEVKLTMSVKGSAEVKIEYTPKFVYCFDFDDIDWSEGNA